MWLPVVAISATPVLDHTWMLAIAAIVAGIGLGMNPPVTVELMARHTSSGSRGLAMGLRVSANRLAQVVQPVLFGSVGSLLGLPIAFAFGGVVLAGLAGSVRVSEVGKPRCGD
jgi:MFS family permease